MRLTLYDLSTFLTDIENVQFLQIMARPEYKRCVLREQLLTVHPCYLAYL